VLLFLGPFTVPVDEEVESQHLKFIQCLPPGMTFGEAVARLNCNISYSGLLHAVTAEVRFLICCDFSLVFCYCVCFSYHYVNY